MSVVTSSHQLRKRREIAQKLIEGENPLDICKEFSCSYKTVLSVLSDEEFARKSLNSLDFLISSFGYVAYHNIAKMALDEKVKDKTRLDALKYMAERAKDDGLARNDGAELSNEQLAESLKMLQDEINKRSIKVDTGVDDIELDDMLE